MSYQEQTSTDQTVTDTRDERLATHSVADTLAGVPDLSRFAALAGRACDDRILRDGEWITVLAPNDAALERVEAAPTGEELHRFIHHHVSNGAKSLDDLRVAAERGISVRMKDGSEVAVRLEGTQIRIGNARIVGNDIECSNGVVHAIDAVLE